MYNPPHFLETRTAEIHRLIDAYPFGTLVVNGPTGLDATHIPFALDASQGPHGTLLAHVARANPLWKEQKDGDEVLVIFRGSDGYVSPNWYPSKHELHRQVPTWNYQVVHVHGKLRIHDDERFLRGVVGRLTRIHEARTGDPKPWRMGDSAKDYIDQLLQAIVGIAVEIDRIEGKSKLSQNKEERDRLGAAQGLQDHGHADVANAMLQAMVPGAK